MTARFEQASRGTARSRSLPSSDWGAWVATGTSMRGRRVDDSRQRLDAAPGARDQADPARRGNTRRSRRAVRPRSGSRSSAPSSSISRPGSRPCASSSPSSATSPTCCDASRRSPRSRASSSRRSSRRRWPTSSSTRSGRWRSSSTARITAWRASSTRSSKVPRIINVGGIADQVEGREGVGGRDHHHGTVHGDDVRSARQAGAAGGCHGQGARCAARRRCQAAGDQGERDQEDFRVPGPPRSRPRHARAERPRHRNRPRHGGRRPVRRACCSKPRLRRRARRPRRRSPRPRRRCRRPRRTATR